MVNRRLDLPLGLVLAYLAFSVLWIVASDRLTFYWLGDAAALTTVQTVKGLLYVVASAAVVYGVARRLHDRARAGLEARVAERTAQLREANAELEAFVYWVAHDLGAPLRAMEGFATALVEDHGEALSPGGRSYAERIAAAALRMDRLIADLLDYSHVRHQELIRTPVALGEAVDAAVDALRAEIDRRGADLAVEGALPRVLAHAGTLHHVLTNLLANALKFVPPGERPRVRIRAEADGGGIRLWVEDRGIGIAAGDKERIFAPFQRLHGRETYPGTGLGLAIVRKGVERMEGGAGVESEPGAGSRFWIRLEAA